MHWSTCKPLEARAEVERAIPSLARSREARDCKSTVDMTGQKLGREKARRAGLVADKDTESLLCTLGNGMDSTSGQTADDGHHDTAHQ